MDPRARRAQKKRRRKKLERWRQEKIWERVGKEISDIIRSCLYGPSLTSQVFVGVDPEYIEELREREKKEK